MATANIKTDAYYNYFRLEKSSNLWPFVHCQSKKAGPCPHHNLYDYWSKYQRQIKLRRNNSRKILFHDLEPLDQKEVDSSDQKRHTAHDSIPEGSTESYHQKPGTHCGRTPEESGVLFGEEEINQAAENTHEYYQAGKIKRH